MIVTFHRHFCQSCNKTRWHEVIVSPCCVTCGTYKMDNELLPIEVDHFHD